MARQDYFLSQGTSDYFCALLSGFLFCKLEKLAYCISIYLSMLKAKTQSRSFTEIGRAFKSIENYFVKATRRS